MTNGILKSIIPDPPLSKYMIDSAHTTRTEAQKMVVHDKAPLGPFVSNTFPYPIKRSKDAGLTKAMASGKAAGALAYPVVDEVKMASVEGLANEYPR